MTKVKSTAKSKAEPKKKPSKQAIAMAQQVQQNKKNLLEGLEKSLGIVTSACKNVGLDRTTFYNYVNSDPEFALAVKNIENVALDFVESHLHKQIAAGVPASTIFYLKTKGKERGYIERSEITGRDGGAVQIDQTAKVVLYIPDNSRDTGESADGE